MCEATEAAQTGWSTTTHVFGMHSGNVVCERPPRPLHQRSLRDIFLMSRPPLLTEAGNTAYSNQFVHTFIDRAYIFLRTRSAATTPRYWASSKMENPLRSEW